MKQFTMPPEDVARSLMRHDPKALVDSIVEHGKAALDSLSEEIGRAVVEGIFMIEREEIAGPRYHPKDSAIKKWAKQQGSVFLGKSRKKVMVPRLRGPKGEIPLKSYQALRKPDVFADQLLTHMLTGMSGRRYSWLVHDASERLGVSPSSVSRHVVQATAHQLQRFRERNLEQFSPFAVLIDSVHRGGRPFIVALGISAKGEKLVFGFWEGATENHEVCLELLNDITERGLVLHEDVLFITDGGKGLIKALRMRFGDRLLHQRCTVHKCRNILSHLPDRYHGGARMRFNRAIDMDSYDDAKRELLKLEKWLRPLNESAANSLLEAFEEILTLHKLNITGLLRRTLRSTNGIESLFSRVRYTEKNIKRWRSSRMCQRWLGTVLLQCEKGFRLINGHNQIPIALSLIKEYRLTLALKEKAA
jgi:putative transposase